MRRLTLCLQLDAFRPDYLRYAPYLRELASGSAGELREPFGFLPHAAYFGGLTPGQLGFSNQYAYDPERSPFGAARAIGASRSTAGALERQGFRRFLDESARSRVKPFARSYASSAAIPIDLLPSFDLVEQRAPWDRAVGYRSIFHELDEQRLDWFVYAWPSTNDLPDHSDRAIVRAALDRARPESRYAFVHLQELDGCGHQYGPESPEVRECVRATDQRTEELVESLRRRYDDLDLVIFADHGMVSVTTPLDLLGWLDCLPLRRSIDYTPFLDSTMARFWLHTERARAELPEALATIAGTRLLSAEDLRRFQMDGCDPRNGELFLLADPGVVLLPNFFQGDGMPRGMHGYDPDDPDNRGLFICRSSRVPPPPRVVDATEIYRLTRETVFADPPMFGRSTPAAPAAVRFTTIADPAATAAIASDLDVIVRSVVEEIGEPEAIVLTGSFGRGEGGIVQEGTSFRPVNDYDLLVVSPVDVRAALTELGRRLPRELGIDYVDLAWSDGRWDRWSPSMANVDLKYGSAVLRGNHAVLDSLPLFASGEIPSADGVQLLLNRMAGLLTGMRAADFAADRPLATEARRYLTNQYVKAAVALGDSYLLSWRGYDASYLARGRRFRSLAPGAGVDSHVIDLITQAYALKVAPDYSAIDDVPRAVRTMARLLLRRFNEQLVPSHPSSTPIESSAAYLTMPFDTDRRADDERLLAREAVRTLVRSRPETVSLRQVIYAAIPLLLESGVQDVEPSAQSAMWPVAQWLDLPPAIDGWTTWDELRQKLVAAWFAVVH